MAQTLALDAVAHGEETGWRKGEYLIDALAYIDPLTKEEKAKVDALIMEEVKTECNWAVICVCLAISCKPENYLKSVA